MSQIEQNMRLMAWERAKGELRSILTTYGGADADLYDETSKRFEEFIDEIEGNAIGGLG